ncbi:head-tail connector protein [Gemmobacter nectariphilus]|uniref:head-tail connector protein n=1 Tax=Gemmobacter nectariphilus TaxID=220343 RepID=UPI0004123FBC|nr:head-tail connector protein [Gemmobacter nectariphilus]
MAIVTLDQMKEQIGWTDDLGTADDDLLSRKIDAAQAYLERWLGYAIADRFGGDTLPAVPAPLVEAVCQLAAWWFDQRETASEGAREVPHGFAQIVDSYRDWSF